MTRNRCISRLKSVLTATVLTVIATSAQAEIDGHGPDGWRVTGIKTNDVLNARMGPGTAYPVIEAFAHNERDMQQITCVPFYTVAHYTAMTETQIKALPPRWCLMRNKAMTKAGWVAQRFIAPEGEDAGAIPPSQQQRQQPKQQPKQPKHEPYTSSADIDPIAQAQDLVREIYERQFQSENSQLPSAFDPAVARNYFTDEIVALLASGKIGAHPLYGAQDFDGTIEDPMPDPHQPMLRGMITINVDFTNFGKKQRAVFYLRADTTKPGAPLRIFRVEHEGWSYP